LQLTSPGSWTALHSFELMKEMAGKNTTQWTKVWGNHMKTKLTLSCKKLSPSFVYFFFLHADKVQRSTAAKKKLNLLFNCRSWRSSSPWYWSNCSSPQRSSAAMIDICEWGKAVAFHFHICLCPTTTWHSLAKRHTCGLSELENSSTRRIQLLVEEQKKRLSPVWRQPEPGVVAAFHDVWKCSMPNLFRLLRASESPKEWTTMVL
jgi:hypothetical protein